MFKSENVFREAKRKNYCLIMTEPQTGLTDGLTDTLTGIQKMV